MKRITKINENEYISKEVEHTTSFTGTIIELILYLHLLQVLSLQISLINKEINSFFILLPPYIYWIVKIII